MLSKIEIETTPEMVKEVYEKLEKKYPKIPNYIKKISYSYRKNPGWTS